MKLECRPQRALETKWNEYLLRFLFGGAITAFTGFVAHQWGPVVGGLFLAFPSLLPAAATLIRKHEHSNNAAGVDAAGAAYGSLGLLLFAALVWRFGTRTGHWVPLLLAACALWLAASAGVWWLVRVGLRRRSDRRARSPRRLPAG